MYQKLPLACKKTNKWKKWKLLRVIYHARIRFTTFLHLTNISSFKRSWKQWPKCIHEFTKHKLSVLLPRKIGSSAIWLVEISCQKLHSRFWMQSADLRQAVQPEHISKQTRLWKSCTAWIFRLYFYLIFFNGNEKFWLSVNTNEVKARRLNKAEVENCSSYTQFLDTRSRSESNPIVRQMINTMYFWESRTIYLV